MHTGSSFNKVTVFCKFFFHTEIRLLLDTWIIFIRLIPLWLVSGCTISWRIFKLFVLHFMDSIKIIYNLSLSSLNWIDYLNAWKLILLFTNLFEFFWSKALLFCYSEFTDIFLVSKQFWALCLISNL